jgi:hypothetical protein
VVYSYPGLFRCCTASTLAIIRASQRPTSLEFLYLLNCHCSNQFSRSVRRNFLQVPALIACWVFFRAVESRDWKDSQSCCNYPFQGRMGRKHHRSLSSSFSIRLRSRCVSHYLVWLHEKGFSSCGAHVACPHKRMIASAQSFG